MLPLLLCSSALHAEVLWDNNRFTNGLNGRAVSPPAFPNIRVVDDIVVPAGGWRIDEGLFNVIEDAQWYSGSTIQVYVYENVDDRPGGLLTTVEGSFRREDVYCYFGGCDFIYTTEQVDPIALEPGKYWIGFRNPGGSGSGTNYWMTSDGGPDGRDSQTGFFSLDAGETWMPEGAIWHHAFELRGVPEPSAILMLSLGAVALIRRR
jgi:hypothetical protein